MSKEEMKFPTYKGRPLVRSGDTLYYGDMRDDYVVKIDVKTKKIVQGVEIAAKVSIQMLSTDPLKTGKGIAKTSERNGLYAALDVADAWLDRTPKE